MSEPRYNLRRTPATRGVEASNPVNQRKAPKTAPTRGSKRGTKKAVVHEEPPRSATEKQEARVVKSAKVKLPRKGSRAYKISKLREELSSESSLDELSSSDFISRGDGEGDRSSEGDSSEEGEAQDEEDGEGTDDGEQEGGEEGGDQDGGEEEEEEYEPLLSAAKDAIIRHTPTIIKDVLTLSSSAKEAILRLGRGRPLWGGAISGREGARKAAPKRQNIGHVPVDISVKGSPIPRASSEEGGGVPVRNIQDRSGYRDGFGGARWEEVEPIRRNLSEDLSAVKTSPKNRGKKLKTRYKRKAGEIAKGKSNFTQALVFWILLYLAYSNNRVRREVYGTFNSLTDHPVLQNILGSATSALHTAVTPIAETGIQLFTPQEALLESRIRTSSAAAAAASLDLEKIIRASRAFANLTRPVVIGLIAGELAAEANHRSHWAPNGIRAKIYDLSAAFDGAYEDLRVLTQAFRGTTRRAHERYAFLANIFWDQASAETLPGLRLGERNQQMLEARGQRNKYSGFTVQGKYKIVRSASLREFNGLRALSRKALMSASAAMEKISEARSPEVMVIEKVVEITEPFVAGLEALDKEVYRVVMLFHQEFVVEDYDRWVSLDESLLKGKLEALFAALGRLDGLERLRGSSEEG